MKIHFIIHESFESPGAIELWAKRKGFELSYTRLYDGYQLPQEVELEFDFLVVMGGPQSPDTSTHQSPHFDSKKEIAFIKRAIEQNKILLGVCLGAQLIGEALGGHFERSPNREIGVYPVMLNDNGKEDSIFKTFPTNFMVGHWHGDMPGLTQGAKILAASRGCPRQIVRYAPKIYGFQCHFEFTAETMETMIEASATELKKYKSLPYVENAEQLRSHDYSEMNELLFNFLDKLIKIN